MPRLPVSFRWWLPAAIGALLLALLAGWLWPQATPATDEGGAADAAGGERLDDGRLALTAAQVTALGLETQAITAADALPLPGLAAEAIAPIDGSARVVAPYAGVVTRVLADDGTDVRRGQPLLRIQSREWLLAQADLAQAQGEAQAARNQRRRDGQLLAEGIIAAARNDESHARASAAEAHLRQAQGALSGLRAAPGGLPGEYELLAPIDGHVLRRAVVPGQSLAALEEAFSLSTPGPLDVLFTVPVSLRAGLRNGLDVEVPGGRARVVAIGADTDSSTQRLRVRARADDASGLVAGQHLDVTLRLPAPAGSLAVPARALLSGREHALLYVRDPSPDADARAVFRAVPVTRLGGDETLAVVTGALRPGEHVVIQGASALKPLLTAE